MINKDYNNEFFGWQGVISRKNYAVNIFIVSALYILLNFTDFQSFRQFIRFEFIYTVLIFAAELLKFVLIMCALSLVYRRIADFAGSKPYNFQLRIKRFYVFLFVFPVLYLFILRQFLYFLPFFVHTADLLVFFVLIPAAVIMAVIFCFIKGI